MRREFLQRTAVLGLALSLVPTALSAGAYEDFFKAVRDDDAGTVIRLLQRGFDVNSRDEKGQPALLTVFRDGGFKVAEVLLQHPQLEVDAPNAVGETPLMMAALKGHTDWARRLLDKGARLEKDGWTPLHYAATGPAVPLVELLLDRGARVDARSPNGSTPLMMAARYGAEGSVTALLARGADPRLRNDKDMTSGDFARSVGRDKLGERLDRAIR
ncbi:ankyrin repeat domain-containing protein [Ideonella sp. A 288]|uniref:ankyrin repeat domain-containing protein n=1 Tax=Ideonella sp. A 288 TaxID=1962181 RepID=UPI000B4B13BC|nr:ankyrin repeat domain-containing protein [Ideonella sp. A 288]